MAKSIQIKLSEEQHALIKAAFAGVNISQLIRDFLLSEAEKRLESSDLTLPVEGGLADFIAILSEPAVQQLLFKVFSKSRGGDVNDATRVDAISS